MEITKELPDELPVCYKSWLHFYLDTKNEFEKRGVPIDDKTIVKYATINHEKQEDGTIYGVLYAREWTMLLIKARSLDFVLSKMPTYKQIVELNYYATPHNLRAAIDNLMDITIQFKK